jgi:DNA-binding NtrC family response regulator
VDDDPAALLLKQAILEQKGHVVTTCSNTEDAICKLQEMQFDAVVTDWRLGKDRGHAVVIAAKQNLSLPVVVVSGYVAEAFQAAEPPADLYLEKPVNPQELVQIVNALLQPKTASDGRPAIAGSV